MTSRERFELGHRYTSMDQDMRDFVEEIGTNGQPTGYLNFYNTTKLEGEELARSEAMAEEQNAKVLRIMQEVRRPQTAWEVWERGKVGFPDEWWLIGSVRRAMTTLADPKCGALINLGTKRRSGPRSKLCYEWALPEQTVTASQKV